MRSALLALFPFCLLARVPHLKLSDIAAAVAVVDQVSYLSTPPHY